MNYEELAKGYANAIGMYPGNQMFGTSFLDQFRNAQSGQEYLNSITGAKRIGLQPGQLEGLKASNRGMIGSAIAGGAIAGLSGASQLLTTALQAGQIADTTAYSNQISDLGKVGSYNYNNFDELINDYSLVNAPTINESEVRGMSNGQKASAIGSSVLSGASTGMQIGGPWGALAGAVVGGLSSGLGIMAGNRKAEIQTQFLNAQADLATDMANQNLDAANERLLNRNNRQGAVHAVAKGGQIERREKALKNYKNRSLSGPRFKDQTPVGRVIRKMGKGGTCIRLRIK